MRKTKQQIREERIKGLQKLPNAQGVENHLAGLIVDVLYGEPWDRERVFALPKAKKRMMESVFQTGLNLLALEDRDQFISKIDKTIPIEVRRQLWEINHAKIIRAINKLTIEYHRFPSRNDISIETGLSRQTVNKHLQEYFGSQEHKQRQEDYVLMREKVLARVFAFAIEGDTKAAKLFLEATAHQQPAMHIKNQQNNFVQINGLTITEQQLQELPEAQQAIIIDVLKTINPQKQA